MDALGARFVTVTRDPVAAAYADRVLFLAGGGIADTPAHASATRIAPGAALTAPGFAEAAADPRHPEPGPEGRRAAHGTTPGPLITFDKRAGVRFTLAQEEARRPSGAGAGARARVCPEAQFF